MMHSGWRNRIFIAIVTCGAGAAIIAAAPATQHARNLSPTLQLSADEVNRIRQSLLRDDDTRAEFQFRHDVQQRFAIATSRPVNQFDDASPLEEAMAILRDGDASMREDVRVMTDSPVIAEFKADVLPMIVRGCGSPNGCHGSLGHGDFYISYHLGNAAEVYADFAALRRYVRVKESAKGAVFTPPVKYCMLNTDDPDQSLVVQYALPAVLAQTPHPSARYWAPMLMDKTEVRYRELVKWIAELRDDAHQ